MAIQLLEKPTSNSGRGSFDATTEIDRTWRLKGSDDLEELTDFLAAAAPTTILDPIWDRTLVRGHLAWQRVGGAASSSIYDFTFTYIDPAKFDEKRQLEVGEYRFSFDTSGGTLRITSSLETVESYAPAGKTAPNHHQTIGVTDKGEVPGVDITVPAMRFTLDYRLPLATLTNTYVTVLEMLTGTTNNAIFYARPAGEVLFLGATGSQGTVADPTLAFNFVRLPNLTNQTIGDITGISKLGHEYLWVEYQSVEDATANPKRIVRRPIAVHVERLYQPADFSTFGIGVAA